MRDEDLTGWRWVGEGQDGGVNREGLGVEPLSNDGVVEGWVGGVEGGQVEFSLDVGEHHLGDGGRGSVGRWETTESEGRVDDV